MAYPTIHFTMDKRQPAGKQFSYSPASLDRKPSVDKYYGVTGEYDKPTEHVCATRAFLVALEGYPNPSAKLYRLVCANKMTAGNTYNFIVEKKSSKLEDYILFLYEKKFKVIEFDTAKELFNWLSDCEDKLPRSSPGWR